jgi:hypothetical protein
MCAVLVLVGKLVWNEMHRPFLNKLKQIEPGVTEERVIELLGQPVHVHEGLTAGPDWYKVHSDVGHPRWQHIENKVLIFHGPADYIVYVHIGSQGKVKEVFVGGT